MLEEISAKQMVDWVAYNRLEPFGHGLLYYMLGQIVAMLYNIHRKKGTSMKEPWDFVPFPKEMIPTEQSPKEMKQVMMDLVRQTKKQGKKAKKIKSLGRKGR